MRFTTCFLMAVLVLEGCTNVAQMQKKYEAGDVKQLEKFMKIVARPDYPYSTRKRAATVLGEIGDPQAVPVLISVLWDFDQRSTLKQEALKALGKIGDTTAVEPIGRLLDRSLAENSAELRMAAIPVLGELGGSKAAEMLVNALSYYDLLTLRHDQRTRRGIYSGEEMPNPHERTIGRADSLERPYGDPGIGLLPQERQGYTNLFGLDPRLLTQERYNPTPEERQLTHGALVRVGKAALPVIEKHLYIKRTTPTLRNELLAIVDEIQQQGVSPADSSLVSP